MRTHVALLRGINVGGRNRVSMADLRAVMASLGHTDVATYVQSGNIVFAPPDPSSSTDSLAAGIEGAVAGRLAVRPAVIVVSGEELRQVIRDNPFCHEPNPKAVHAVFSSTAPDAGRRALVAAAVQRAHGKGSADEALVVGRTLYLWTPGGLGRSKLADELARGERSDAGSAPGGTARNWATVLAMARLLDD